MEHLFTLLLYFYNYLKTMSNEFRVISHHFAHFIKGDHKNIRWIDSFRAFSHYFHMKRHIYNAILS